ncbi:MAG: hypothetical protein EU521_00340 [Promethearchaeota archaeon]|nr:MAG: hypothetical protein EU521_00340 [Candidatus Lokiarchaeota archaeon]
MEKKDVSGSETITEKLSEKTPWIFGDYLRKPKIQTPKFKRKISLPMPSRQLGLLVIFIILFILQTGVLYFIYRQPPAIGATQEGDPVFIFQDLHESYIVEGIVASILIFVSSVGYLLLYQASKYVFNRKIALRILVFGIILIVFAFFALQYMLSIKTGTFRQFLQQIIQNYA